MVALWLEVPGEEEKVHLGLAMLGVICGIVAGVLLYYVVEGISFCGFYFPALN